MCCWCLGAVLTDVLVVSSLEAVPPDVRRVKSVI